MDGNSQQSPGWLTSPENIETILISTIACTQRSFIPVIKKENPEITHLPFADVDP